MKNLKFYQTPRFIQYTTIAMVVIMWAAFVLFYPTLEYFKRISYDEQTTGRLLRFDTKTSNYQGAYGGQKAVEYYTAFFSYTIQGKTYQGVDKLTGNTANGVRLKNIMRSADKKLKILYQAKAPEQSIISFK